MLTSEFCRELLEIWHLPLRPKMNWHCCDHFSLNQQSKSPGWIIVANSAMAWKINGSAHWDTALINSYEWEITSKSKMYVKDCDLKRCNWTEAHGEWEKAAGTHCGDTDVALLAPGFQPFASGKGRHDEVMLTACNLRSDIFWTCFCFFFFFSESQGRPIKKSAPQQQMVWSKAENDDDMKINLKPEEKHKGFTISWKTCRQVNAYLSMIDSGGIMYAL